LQKPTTDPYPEPEAYKPEHWCKNTSCLNLLQTNRPFTATTTKTKYEVQEFLHAHPKMESQEILLPLHPDSYCGVITNINVPLYYNKFDLQVHYVRFTIHEPKLILN